jgi:hypothetical protein
LIANFPASSFNKQGVVKFRQLAKKRPFCHFGFGDVGAWQNGTQYKNIKVGDVIRDVQGWPPGEWGPFYYTLQVETFENPLVEYRDQFVCMWVTYRFGEHKEYDDRQHP